MSLIKKAAATAVLVGTLSMSLGVPAMAENRFAAWLPPKHPAVTGAAVPFIKRVEKDSNGKLTFKLIAGGALLGAKNTVSGLRDGVASMGQVAFSYYPAEFPHSALVADLAMIGGNPLAVAAAVTEFTMLDCKPCQDEFKAAGIVHLGNASTSSYALISKVELNSPEALKGIKIRTPGLVWDRWARSVGAVPIDITSSEMLEALSRGQVDATLQPVGAMRTHSLWDVAKFVTNARLGTYRSWGVLTVAAGYWQNLSAKQRRIFLNNSAQSVLGATWEYVKQDQVAEAEFANKGVTMVEPSKALRDEINNFNAKDRAAVIANAKSKLGIANPEPLIATYVALIKKWDGKYKGLGHNIQKMSQMLTKEVYDKVNANTYGL